MLTLSRRAFLASTIGAAAAQIPKKRWNVLFIAVDDMRPDLGCYGNTDVRTPNLDKLASKGLTFLRAYCQQAVCSPSRTSLLTGRRPDTTGIYELETHFRKTLSNVVTLPQLFKNNGYATTGLSKIYHGTLDDADSWSIPSWTPGSAAAWHTPENAQIAQSKAEAIRAGGWRVKPAPTKPGS